MPERAVGWWRTIRDHPVPVVAAAVVVPVLVGAACGALGAAVSPASATLLLVLCVVAAAVTRARPAALAAALAGGAAFDFFLTEPRGSLTISDPNDVAVVVLLLVIGGIVSELVHWALRQQADGARRSGYLEGALSAAEAVTRGDLPAGDPVALVSRQIADVLGVARCTYVAGGVHDVRIARLDHDGHLTRGDRPVDVARQGLPTDEQVAIEVHEGPDVVGHFLLSSATRVARPSLEQRRVAVLLADLVAGRSAPGARTTPK